MLQKIVIHNQRYKLLIILFFTFFLNSNLIYSQELSSKINLKWEISKRLIDTSGNVKKYLNFSGAIFTEKYRNLPVFRYSEKLDSNCNFNVELLNTEYQVVPDISLLASTNFASEPEINLQLSNNNGVPYANFTILPYRKNPSTGQIEILNSFNYKITLVGEAVKPILKKASATVHSVLATGDWYKLQISETGIYKIDYNYLTSIGINPDNINPKNIKIYGNGGGMLPQLNSASRIDDLAENAIYISGEADGKFDKGDYVLFYAQGPHSWSFSSTSLVFKHQFNSYSEFSCYFITIGADQGKRISAKPTASGAVAYTSSSYNYRDFHELNLQTDVSDYVKSGRDLFGEDFNYTTIRKFPFYVPNINTTFPVKLNIEVAARSGGIINSSFDINIDGNFFKLSTPITNTIDYNADYCLPARNIFSYLPTSATQECVLKFNKATSSSIGWLNYIELNARADLIFIGNQLSFRDTASIKPGICEYQIVSSYNDMLVWNVTDPTNVEQQELTIATDKTSFKIDGNKLSEFYAFRQGAGLTPKFVEKTPNQDLHSLQGYDMVIVTYPDFKEAADKLADFHRNNDTLQVYVTTPAEIYNEFSSGAQDITAIRDFMKMLYERGQNEIKKPRYLLLMGDASYDYKDILKNNTNFVPTYESYTSYSPTYSYASDDYYGFMDNSEGNYDYDGSYDKVDIAVGRIPVQTKEQAMEMVLKILNYKSIYSFGDWRNKLLLIADDEDSNDYFDASESLDDYFSSNLKEIDVSKVYLDAFVQVTTPGGNRYPDAQLAITKNINSGYFAVNYIGHGGEQYLAHEKIIEIPDINSWSNFDKLSLFVTATCEFTRFDDPKRTSAGELVFLNPKGGAIVMLTTTRVVYSSNNEVLLNNLYKNNLYNENNGNFSRIGDISNVAKNRTGFDINTRKFAIIGDPALVLNYPKHEVITTSINEDTVSLKTDTLKALSIVKITGEIRDHQGIKVNDFNGILYPIIYDKPSDLRTLGNDPASSPDNFTLFNNIIYKGVVSVTNGSFTFSFVVPKDISYKYGFGKISYYATNNTTDANGEYNNIIIGGSVSYINKDTIGPEVNLFLNDSNFIRGGITNENPWLYAKVKDENGINTVGNGIGHEIIGILDDGVPIVLNDYYRATLNNYQEGIVKYPFSNLLPGKHKLYIKVWDVMNNSSEDSTEFVIMPSQRAEIRNLFNYPNPVRNSTTFSFETNLSNQAYTATLQIFNQMGKLIKTIKTNINSEASRITSIKWDLRNDQDPSLPNGLYLYRLTLEDLKGQIVSKSNKLILVN